MTISQNYVEAHTECVNRSNAQNDEGAKFIVDSINRDILVSALAAEQGWPQNGPPNEPSAVEMHRIYNAASVLFDVTSPIYDAAAGRLLMTNSAQWIKT